MRFSASKIEQPIIGAHVLSHFRGVFVGLAFFCPRFKAHSHLSRCVLPLLLNFGGQRLVGSFNFFRRIKVGEVFVGFRNLSCSFLPDGDPNIV